MDKVEFTWELSEESKRHKERVYALLVKDARVKAWLKEHDLPKEFVYEHTGKFMDWLDQIKRCEHCQGLRYCTQKVQGCYMDLYIDGFLDFVMRPCTFAQNKQAAMAHARYYTQSSLSEDQLFIDLTQLDITKESPAYRASLARIVSLLQQDAPRKGFYLWGKPGAGKTYLAAGITNYFARQKHSVAFVSVPKLIAELKLLFYEHAAMERKLNSLAAAEVLVLDDIGGESVTAWSRDEVLLPLLDLRMERHRLTFFTGNYNLAELKERYVTTNHQVSEPMAAERLAERIMALAEPEFIKGDSRRI